MLTDPSSIAWAFNIRGGDVPHTPLALGFAILAADGSHLLFMDKRKLPHRDRSLSDPACRSAQPGALEAEIAALAKAGAKIALDPVLAAEQLRMLVEENGGTVVAATDPARIPRATKNQAEIAGTRAAHRRDGAAVVKLLCWLDRQQPGTLDEITVVTQAGGEPRRATGEETQMPLRDVSFDTISGAGPERRHHALPRVARQPTASSPTASCSCSIPARSIRTAPPTSPAPCRSARRPTRCASATRWC